MYNLLDTIKIIIRISEGSRSEVYLASDVRGELVIYKKIPGDDKNELYRRVNSVSLKSKSECKSSNMSIDIAPETVYRDSFAYDSEAV